MPFWNILEVISVELLNLDSYGSDIIDVYQTPRPCGGSHTTTYTQKKMVRMGNVNNSYVEEDVHGRLLRDELDLQGADGHIYKGRLDRSQTTVMNNSNSYTELPSSDKLPPVTSTQRSQTLVNNNYTPRGAFITSRPKSAAKITPRPTINMNQTRPASARVNVPEADSRPTSPILNMEQSLTDIEESQVPSLPLGQFPNNEILNTSESFNFEVLNQSENEPQSTDEALLL